ncbi:LysR family transcriptional regulator [Paenarthrobacter sp. NPDC090522]|uniref:LysR family transcriptional regulator n=1 Tax=Paenarthrobacter sp. NPDC090522 TaxID=3364383 RepID=UPI00382D5C18
MAERWAIENLRYVQAVTETRSFSAAARAYGVTQPALSNGVAKLEEQLGERLFERLPRGVSPTAFGSHLLPLIDQAVAAVDKIAAEAGRWSNRGSDSIRMGVSPLINPRLIAAAYNAVCRHADAPATRTLVLREANMDELHDALLAEELDIILIPSVLPLPRYTHRIVDSEPMVIVEGRNDGATGPIQVSDIGIRSLILVPNACGLTTFTRDLFSSRELPLNTYPGEASSYRMLEQWADLGLGTALLPQSKLTNPDTARRPLLDQDQEVEIFYEAVWDPRSPLAAELEDLASHITHLPHAAAGTAWVEPAAQPGP